MCCQSEHNITVFFYLRVTLVLDSCGWNEVQTPHKFYSSNPFLPLVNSNFFIHSDNIRFLNAFRKEVEREKIKVFASVCSKFLYSNQILWHQVKVNGKKDDPEAIQVSQLLRVPWTDHTQGTVADPAGWQAPHLYPQNWPCIKLFFRISKKCRSKWHN